MISRKITFEFFFSCNSKDELSHIKSASTRLNESSEPVCLLSDPKDGRGLYVIYNNVNSSTSSFHKLSKSSNSDPILTWNFTVQQASIGKTRIFKSEKNEKIIKNFVKSFQVGSMICLP